MRRSRESTTSTPSSSGSAPPDRPLPEPRATHGTPASWQARTTAATSSPVPGSTAARGHGRVLQQPVGLVGAKRVVLGDDVLVAADAPQLLDQLPTTIHERTLVLCR